MLDVKDKKILYHLNLDCRQSMNSLSKKIGLAKEVIAYRIKRLEEKGIIKNYDLELNSLKLGYLFSKIYVKFTGFSDNDIKELMKFCESDKKIGFITLFYGDYDFSLSIRAKTLTEIKVIEDKFFENFGNKILNSNLMLGVSFNEYALDYLIENNTHEQVRMEKEVITPATINDIDKNIIRLLTKNAKTSSVSIAKKLGLTANAISYRIKKLVDEEIILRFKAIISTQKIGNTKFRILMHFGACPVEQKNKMITYLSMNNRVIFLSEYIGITNLELIVHYESINEVYDFMRTLGQQFPNVIKDFKVLVMGNTIPVNLQEYIFQ